MQYSNLNPDWEVAQLHGISTLPGIVDPDKPKQQIIICPCCLNTIHKQQASLCENSKELEFLGFGFPLFYVFIKYCILLLLVSITSYNGIALYWAINGSNEICSKFPNGCTSFMINIARIENSVENSEVVVRVCSFIVQLAMLLYIRDLITKTRNYYDQRTCSLSDYSIIMDNLPKKTGLRRKLLIFLQSYFDKPFYPAQITFLPDCEEFYQLQRQITEIFDKTKGLMKDQQNNKDEIQQLQRLQQKKQKQLLDFCNKQCQRQENDQCITEKLIFSCQTQDQKCQILQKFGEIQQQKLRQAFGLQKQEECDIELDDAPQPKELNWQHVNYPDNKRIGRMILGWILTTIFLGSITIVFFFVLSEKSHLIEEYISGSSTELATSSMQYNIAMSLVYVSLIFVIFFNKFVMGFVLHKICDFERHPTTAQEEFHFALKYSVGMFFTTALMTLAVEDLKYNNFYTKPYGVIEEETVMFFMNAFFIPLIWLINPWQIHVLIRRKLNYGRKDMTQKQANKIMENMQYNMGKRYAEILQIMWFTYLYSSLIPFGTFLSAIGLGLYYWVDKYNLLRRSSVNSNIAGELSLYAMKLLDLTLLCKPIGQLIFDSQIRGQLCVTSIVMCVVAVVYLVAPLDNLLSFLHPEKFKTQQRHFSAIENNFKETYQTLHPIFCQKKQNQDKMFSAFKLLGSMFQNTVQILVKPIDNNELNVQSPNPLNPSKALQNSTNILQALFKKHTNYIFKEKDKSKKQDKTNQEDKVEVEDIQDIEDMEDKENKENNENKGYK